MECKYQNKDLSRGRGVATLGLSIGVSEGFPISDYPMESGFYTKEEIENNGLDVLEAREVGGKYKAMQEFAQMLMRWGCRIGESAVIPYTHKQRCDVAARFLEKLRGLPTVSSAEVVGSVKNGNDSAVSDIDIKILANCCPGQEYCDIVGLAKDYFIEPLDIFCNPKVFRKEI
jgi:hypothetical protein